MNLIEAMQMFVAVVEHGSYTKAAEALNVHRPALSKLIQNLEHELGVQLLHRTTRRVNTTPAGDEFYERSLKLLSDLADTLDWFSPTRPPRGKLRIDMQTVLGHAIVIPRLPEFMERYPGLEISLGASDNLNDLIAGGIDCSVRLGDLDDSSLVAKRIGEVALVTCAAPSYVKKYGLPGSLDDLQAHLAVNFMVEQRRQIMPWRFRGNGKTISVKMRSGIVVDNAEALLYCALAGIGMVQGLRPALQRYIDSGRLVEVLPDVPVEPKAVSVLFPERRHLSPNVRVFVEWVSALFQEKRR
ncbi:LysR family transcriptional regulator [Stutzerimonas stutzeri]|uniref:Transcriptional regulator n=1 Tax=Stutzerimonas stutzeri TaxID=316 RepID=A0A0D9AMW6_STUST|nr:LysR family transcriptional regulator [Stutzerimonas stutzeri]KJH82087.1 transcriptional regulator [Stutzerimonas stutzeri]